MKHLPSFILAALLTISLSGCTTLDTITQVGASAAAATGLVSAEHADSIARTTSAAGKAIESITPEQEYYIGRAVAASIVHNYKPYDSARLNEYLNQVGQSLALASDRPETFGGYHFLAMDTDEINAFAAPGGLVLVSRGLLRCCQSEDALAAVLAHEIGHIQHSHGLKAIRKSRLTSALTILAAESAKNLGGQDLAQLTTAFEGSIGDITATLVNSGYSRKSETEADRAAVAILKRVGYNPQGLRDMLVQMGQRMKPEEAGFAKTHPDPHDRISDIAPMIEGSGAVSPPLVRTERFGQAMSGV